MHTPEYKEMFAEQYRAHSECVARRIARQLWEYKLDREKGGKQYVDRPNMMYTLVRVMQAFKSPCSSAQERELRSLFRAMGIEDRPDDLYGEYQRRREALGPSERTEYEREAEELSEQYAEERQREFAAHVFGAEYKKNAGISVPTPVHLMAALV